MLKFNLTLSIIGVIVKSTLIATHDFDIHIAPTNIDRQLDKLYAAYTQFEKVKRYLKYCDIQTPDVVRHYLSELDCYFDVFLMAENVDSVKKFKKLISKSKQYEDNIAEIENTLLTTKVRDDRLNREIASLRSKFEYATLCIDALFFYEKSK